MQLKIEKRKEGDHYFYYVPLNEGKIARTHSIEEVPCAGTDRHELVHAEVNELPSELASQIAELAKNYDQLELCGTGFKLKLSKEPPSNTTVCMVNIDLDAAGRIIGIEVV